MKFDIKLVNHYLSIINDSNPIHQEIVPGQLVCEWLLEGIEWGHYTVKYKYPIYINETLEKETQNNLIQCKNSKGVVKISVKKTDIETQ